MNDNRIDQLGNTRLSTNMSVGRQTPKADFGDRLQAGLNAAQGAVAGGLAVAGNFIPGASVLSAAVSSMGTASQGMSRTGVTSQYASGVVGLGGAGTGTGGGALNTTVGTGGTGGVAGTGLFTSGQTTGTMVNNLGGGVLSEEANDLNEMLNLQVTMQRENQVFTTLSNVLKTRHDTVKNTIQNVH